MKSLIFILLSSLFFSCAYKPLPGYKSRYQVSGNEELALKQFNNLLSKVISEIDSDRQKPYVCMDIGRLKSLGTSLEESKTLPKLMELRHNSLNDYCQYSAKQSTQRVSSELRAKMQLQLLKDRIKYRIK